MYAEIESVALKRAEIPTDRELADKHGTTHAYVRQLMSRIRKSFSGDSAKISVVIEPPVGDYRKARKSIASTAAQCARRVSEGELSASEVQALLEGEANRLVESPVESAGLLAHALLEYDRAVIGMREKR